MDSGTNMDNNNRYLLVGDHCDQCTYIQNSFTLLQLPLQQIEFTDVLTNDDDFKGTSVIIVCPTVEKANGSRIADKIKNSTATLMSSLKAANNHQIRRIEMPAFPFTITAMKDALAQCEINHTNEIEAEDDQRFAILNKLIGHSEHICKIRNMIKQVADSDSTVLILGQSGTGKDVIASCIHALSKRSPHPLVPINCGAIPSELMESELFGHEKGAFTGALTKRAGRFEIANNGTLFLDEIGDMPLNMQVKLLRVIQDRTIDRVGGNAAIKVDVRLIAATNKNLEELIQQNRFREDLFYRLNVFPINVPKLADRKDDIPLLIEHHLQRIYSRLSYRVQFTENAIESLCQYGWPGNIRELENFLERMVILYRDEVIDADKLDTQYKQNTAKTTSLPPEIAQAPFNIKEYIAGMERQLIEFALEKSNGLVSAAAEYLSLGKSTLIDKMKKYDLIDAKSDEVTNG
jgi:sigma-54 specific flagellar transcriptional regulator A